VNYAVAIISLIHNSGFDPLFFFYDRDRRLIQTSFPSGKTIINDYADPAYPSNKSRLRQIRTPQGNIDFTYMQNIGVKSSRFVA